MPSPKKLTLLITFNRLLLSKLSPTGDEPQPPLANSRVSLPMIPHPHPRILDAVSLPTCATPSQVATMPTQMCMAIMVPEMGPEMTPEMILGKMTMMKTMRTGSMLKVT